jgi:predicted RecB family nuclease
LNLPAIPLEQLPGLDDGSVRALAEVGLTTVQDLYYQTQRPEQQAVLAQLLRLHRDRVRRWAALSDLALVPGVGCRWCGVLLHGGVLSRQQLAEQQPGLLFKRLQRLALQITGECPTGTGKANRTLSPDLAQVNQWIAAAQQPQENRSPGR